MIAVISADLLSSSSYSKTLLEKVIMVLKEEFRQVKSEFSESPEFKIYRGDSFQGIIAKPEESLKIALQIKAAINSLHTNDTASAKAFKREADLRLAIGIGTYDFKRNSISESNGQAFQFSGRTLDSMKGDNRKTLLKTPLEEVNDEFDVSFFLLDTLLEKWSTASAEVIYYLIKGYKETDIASELDISQSAVNQRKKAAGWDAIDALLTRYHIVVSKNFSDGK